MKYRQRPALKTMRHRVGKSNLPRRAHRRPPGLRHPGDFAALCLIGAGYHIRKMNRQPVFIRAGKLSTIMDKAAELFDQLTAIQ